ncbi:DUF2911 domain-containing protein [Aquimarina rhabdastrellae]
MSKLLKRLLIAIVGIFILGYLGFSFLRMNTKKHSPEETITHTIENIDFSVFYNRPYKKGRIIFGDLIPYGKVWRTGANEATTFTTSKDITIDGSLLKAGTYSLWTIPNEKSWKVIFNSKVNDWGVNMSGEAAREKQYDALTIEVPVTYLKDPVEQFTIYFEDANGFSILYLTWDTTAIAVPIGYAS